MRPRCVELARVLRKTASFYYHCDWHGSHYVKVMLDQLLGEDNFRSERLRNGLERSPVARSPVWADRDGLPRPLHTVRPIVVRRRGVEFEIG